MKHVLAVVTAAAIAAAACGSSSTPILTSPTQTPAATSNLPRQSAKLHAIGGMVASVEKPTRAVAGARVEVVSGPDAGRSVLSQADGAFLLDDLTPGQISLRVTKDGYQIWTLTNAAFYDDMKVLAELFPQPPVSSSGATA